MPMQLPSHQLQTGCICMLHTGACSRPGKVQEVMLADKSCFEHLSDSKAAASIQLGDASLWVSLGWQPSPIL